MTAEVMRAEGRAVSASHAPAIQHVASPVSRPEVAKSHTGGSPSSTSAPSGTAVRPPYVRSAPIPARANPAAVSSSPPRTAADTGSTPTAPAATSSHCHRVPVDDSTRSPALNTGPFPASTCRTVRT